ncbi:MAG: hypothetical protein MJ193_05450 [Clostridia bacterium]|nr:hypothetical protein [Clostridia bacterium]
MSNGKIAYSETEKSIVAILAEADGKGLTLAEISAKLGKELKSGNINALVKKGNVSNENSRTIVCPCCGAKKTVKEYAFVKAVE